MKKLISVFLVFWFLLSGFWFPVSAADYTLASGDQLEIRIIGHSVFDTKQAIAPDGTISLPAVGRIKAQGLTLAELDNSVVAGFSKYIENPQIVVYLTQQPDFLDKNWYKVITATAVVVGIYSTLR